MSFIIAVHDQAIQYRIYSIKCNKNTNVSYNSFYKQQEVLQNTKKNCQRSIFLIYLNILHAHNTKVALSLNHENNFFISNSLFILQIDSKFVIYSLISKLNCSDSLTYDSLKWFCVSMGVNRHYSKGLSPVCVLWWTSRLYFYSLISRLNCSRWQLNIWFFMVIHLSRPIHNTALYGSLASVRSLVDAEVLLLQFNFKVKLLRVTAQHMILHGDFLWVCTPTDAALKGSLAGVRSLVDVEVVLPTEHFATDSTL